MTQDQLKKFDEREKNYSRIKVELDNVTHVPFLPDDMKDDNHEVFEAKESTNNDNVFVWIYVQDELLEPNSSYPIAQSYIGTWMLSSAGAYRYPRSLLTAFCAQLVDGTALILMETG